MSETAPFLNFDRIAIEARQKNDADHARKYLQVQLGFDSY